MARVKVKWMRTEVFEAEVDIPGECEIIETDDETIVPDEVRDAIADLEDTKHFVGCIERGVIQAEVIDSRAVTTLIEAPKHEPEWDD
jgi:hypothetical protein